MGGSVFPMNAKRRFASSALAIALLCGVLFAHPAGAQTFWDDLLVGVEVLIGDSVAQSVREEYGGPVRLSRGEQQRLDRVFADITAQAKRKEIPYSLTVLGSDVVNAFAAPGGHIFVTTGLLRYIQDDIDALANVLGHEVAHVEHKHGMNAITQQVGIGLLLQFLLGGADETIQTVAAVALELTRLGWSREQEYESDSLGQRLAAAAGYDPAGMVRFFEILGAIQGEEVAFLEFLSTHPLTSERAERARARANTLRPAQSAGAEAEATRQSPAPAGSSGPAGSTGPAGPTQATREGSAGSEGGSVGRVLTRRSTPTPVTGALFEDPAQRFSVRLPVGWALEPVYYYDAVEFTGPEGDRLWLVAEERSTSDRDSVTAANRTLAYYAEVLSNFAVTSGPTRTTLAGQPAAYAEFRYTRASGAEIREGSYFLLSGDGLYMLQYAAAANEFDARKDRLHSAGATFELGSSALGDVSAEALRVSATTPVDILGLFTIEVSPLWPVTYEQDADALEDGPHLAELSEIGSNGYMNVYMYEVWEGARSVDTATEWAEWLLDIVPGAVLVEAVGTRRINGRNAASFVVSWEDDGERWIEYATTIVVGGYSYEIGIVYRADGFDVRRPVFDRWIESWRF